MRVKLIRDDMVVGQGGTTRPVNSLAGKQLALVAKLHEEAAEIARDPTDAGEYGDLLEVMNELGRLNGVSFEDMLRAQAEKRAGRGGFEGGRMWLVDVPERASDWPPADLGGYGNRSKGELLKLEGPPDDE